MATGPRSARRSLAREYARALQDRSRPKHAATSSFPDDVERFDYVHEPCFNCGVRGGCKHRPWMLRVTSEKRILNEGLVAVSELPASGVAQQHRPGMAGHAPDAFPSVARCASRRAWSSSRTRGRLRSGFRARRHSRRGSGVRVRARSEDRHRPAVGPAEEVSSGIRTRRGALRAVSQRRRSRASHGGVAEWKG
jgi:hypothetical protein